MPVKFNDIGIYNKQLVLDLKAGKTHTSGTLIEDWRHENGYHYELAYGVYACGNPSCILKGKYIGVKYYCSTKEFAWDMAKRIVHIYEKGNQIATQRFYRLIHTDGKPGLRDNSYRACEEIIEIP